MNKSNSINAGNNVNYVQKQLYVLPIIPYSLRKVRQSPIGRISSEDKTEPPNAGGQAGMYQSFGDFRTFEIESLITKDPKTSNALPRPKIKIIVNSIRSCVLKITSESRLLEKRRQQIVRALLIVSN